MLVARRLPCPVGIIRSSQRIGYYTLVTKVSLALSAGPTRWAATQAPLRSAVYDQQSNLTFPTDYQETKSACDVVIAGATLTMSGPVRLRVGPFAHHVQGIRQLGPVDEALAARKGSFARPNQQLARPEYPLPLEVIGHGLQGELTVVGPVLSAALIIRNDWSAPSEVQLQLDGILLDPIRDTAELVMRGHFHYVGDIEQHVIAVVDSRPFHAISFAEARTAWPRYAASFPPATPSVAPVKRVSRSVADDETIDRQPLAAAPYHEDTFAAGPLSSALAQGSFDSDPTPVEADRDDETLPKLRRLEEPSEVTKISASPMLREDALPFHRPPGRTVVGGVAHNALPFSQPPPPPAYAELRATSALPFTQAHEGLPFQPAGSQPPFSAEPPAVSDTLPPMADTLPPSPLPSAVAAPLPPSPLPSAVAAPLPPARAPNPPGPLMMLSPAPAIASTEQSRNPINFPPTLPSSHAASEHQSSTQLKIDGVTFERFAQICGRLWRGENRRELLRSEGLTELGWRLVERRWKLQLELTPPGQLGPMLALLDRSQSC